VPQGSVEASSSRNGAAPPEIRPNLIALVSLTHTLCEAGRVQEAEELCRMILKEQPGLAIAQAGLGRALYEAGKLDDAELCLERTVGQTPGCFAAHRWLAEVLVQKGAWDRAQLVLGQAAVLSPENPRVRQLLQTLPRAAPSPTATEPGRPAHAQEVAAQVERPVPPRPRTTEYPAANYEELPYVDLDALGSDDIEDFVTEPHVPKLRRRTLGSALSRARARALALSEGLDWRAIGAAAGVGLGLAIALGVALWVMSGPGQVPLSPPDRASTRAPAPLPDRAAPSGEAERIRRAQERAIAAGDLPELLAAVEEAAPQLGVPEVASARLFTTALLASEYGLRIPVDTHILLRRLLESAPRGRLAGEIAASRLLLSLAAGDLASALPGDQQAAENPWLAFAVAKARRLAGEPMRSTRSDFGPALVLQAEAFIDAGETGRARTLLSALVERVPSQTRARLVMAEARVASALPASAEETTGLRGACALDAPRSPFVDGACRLLSAQEARRTGDRTAARARALQVAALAPPEPRLLALTAQLLFNLGETKRADELVTQARTFAGPTYPPLAWATLGGRINRGEIVPVEQALLPAGPEARLLAVRSALARGGAAGIGTALRNMGPQQVNAEPDLSWFAALSRVQQRRPAVRMAERFMKAARPPSPVGAYVLGLLARWGGRRHLAAYWLARAREGHGDSCRAAVLYVATEGDLGRRPPPGAIPSDCDRRKRRR
jgi:tetratricopeptide (TPR) repeat protein